MQDGDGCVDLLRRIPRTDRQRGLIADRTCGSELGADVGNEENFRRPAPKRARDRLVAAGGCFRTDAGVEELRQVLPNLDVTDD